MGISGDYVDSTFEHSIYLRPPDSPVGYEPQDLMPEPSTSLSRSMLPVPKDSIASQECVEENQIGEPADGKVDEVVGEPDMVGHSGGEQRERAPLQYVHGEHWSPGVYHLLRLCRCPLEVAWERAFVARPTF
jgi:hypothetical protein